MKAAQVIPFDFEKKQVRVTVVDGDPWFVAADVCKAIGVTNTTQALQALDGDERSMFNIGRQGSANIISESGLFTLILRSREATTPGTPQHRFRKWVTAEVLPAIRRTGQYHDSSNKMATLVGETIGTNGFNMLGAVIKGKVVNLPVDIRRRVTTKIWSQLHTAFGVRSASDIPAQQLDAARNFVAAYAIDGEWMGPEEPKVVGRLAIDFTVARWIAENPYGFENMPLKPVDRIRVPIRALHGMDCKSPTLALLGILAHAGYEVEACALEVLALKEHVEVLDGVMRNIQMSAENTRSRAFPFPCKTKAASA